MAKLILWCAVAIAAILAFISAANLMIRINAKNSEKPPVEFDFRGMRMGDEIPDRLLAKCKPDELKNRLVTVREYIKDDDLKADVSYSYLDRKLASIYISFSGIALMDEAYRLKFGPHHKLQDNEYIWNTTDGEFHYNWKLGYAELKTQAYDEYQSAEYQKDTAKKSKQL